MPAREELPEPALVQMCIRRDRKAFSGMTGLASGNELPEMHVLVTRSTFAWYACEPPGSARAGGEGPTLDSMALRAGDGQVAPREPERSPVMGKAHDSEPRSGDRVADLTVRSHLAQMHVGMARRARRRRVLVADERRTDSGRSGLRRCLRERRRGRHVTTSARDGRVTSAEEVSQAWMVERPERKRSGCGVACLTLRAELARVYVRMAGGALRPQPAKISHAFRDRQAAALYGLVAGLAGDLSLPLRQAEPGRAVVERCLLETALAVALLAVPLERPLVRVRMAHRARL